MTTDDELAALQAEHDKLQGYMLANYPEEEFEPGGVVDAAIRVMQRARAPKAAAPVETTTVGPWYSRGGAELRPVGEYDIACAMRSVSFAGMWFWEVEGGTDAGGYAPTLEAAQAAADEALRELGYVVP